MLIGHIYPARLDWPGIITDIKAAGCTRYRIAAILGVGESTVQGWEQGSDPRHSMGVAILALHEQLCPDTTEKRCNGVKVSA